MILAGCIENQYAPKQTTEKLSIVTTIYPLYEFAKEVGKDKVEVTLLLPPGAEAHTFEPKPSDIIKINKAQLFIYTGAGMEPWAEDILQGIDNKKLITLNSSKQVNLISLQEETHEHNHSEGYDPHIWLDFSNDTTIVISIAEELSKIDANNSQTYLQNAENYIKKLNELDKEYSKTLSTCKHQELVTGGHSAFGYLAKKYNLQMFSASNIAPDSEPTPQKIKEIIDLIKNHGIKYIYYEELVNPNIAQAIANETTTKILILNPFANLTKEKFDNNITFIQIMKDNLESLKIGLECD